MRLFQFSFTVFFLLCCEYQTSSYHKTRSTLYTSLQEQDYTKNENRGITEEVKDSCCFPYYQLKFKQVNKKHSYKPLLDTDTLPLQLSVSVTTYLLNSKYSGTLCTPKR